MPGDTTGCLAVIRSVAWYPLGCVLLLLFWTGPFAQVAENGTSGVDEALERAREISYQQHWREAQAILDELAPRLDEFSQRSFVKFHLLEARHLALENRSGEALERAGMLLELELDDDQRLRTLQFSANIAVLLRDYETAFDHLISALALEGRVEDPTATIATYNMASYMFGKVGEHERAVDYGRTAIERALAHGDANDECVARQRVAPVYKWADETALAEDQYRAAIRVCRSIDNELFTGVVQHGLADLLRMNGRLEEARALAESAIDALVRAVYPLGEHEARLVLAETLFDLGERPGEGERSLDELAEYFRDNELWDLLARLEALRARVAIRDQDTDAALRHLQLEREARDRFLSRDRVMRLAYLEVQFDTRLKEQRIELLEERARVAQLKAQTADQQRKARTIILALSIFVALLLFGLLGVTLRGRRHFRYLSRHDHLSGLPNQRWFQQRAESLLRDAAHAGSGVYLVMADIDHFKAINDQYGHLMGDQVLGQIARRLKKSFDEDALIGRVGGEEFALLVQCKDVRPVLEGIKKFQRVSPGDSRSGDPEVTLSFGIAAMRPGDSLQSLRQRADRALYRAKQTGRNRYVISDEPGGEESAPH